MGLTGGGGPARLKYSAYVDAIRLQNVLGRPEFRLPPNSQYHANYYQTAAGLRGQSIPTSQINHRVTNQDAGGNVHHVNIDDTAFVRDAIINTIKNRMPLNSIQ
jgi:hypothetical protein